MSILRTNKFMKQLGDFPTRTPKYGEFTHYVYVDAFGKRTSISRKELSPEIDDALYEEMKRENNNNRAQVEDNRAISKDQGKHQALLYMYPSEIVIEDCVISLMRNEKLREALKALKPGVYEMIIKSCVDNETNTQIAKELGVKEGTIRYRLKRVKEQLKRSLQDN